MQILDDQWDRTLLVLIQPLFMALLVSLLVLECTL